MKLRSNNTAKDVSIAKEFNRSIRLIDIDNTIAKYVTDSILPILEESGKSIKVPLLYGNAERWENVRKNGYLRDERGKIQIPLVVFKRNSIERDSSLIFFREKVTMPAYKKYSLKHKYERFNIQTGTTAPIEHYNVSMPDYVTVSYEFVLWTSYTEHMNSLVEAFQYASDRYWGEEFGYKFRAIVGSLDTQQEIGDSTERVIKTTFTLIVHAHLLPKEYASVPTVTKSLSGKAIVTTIETDLHSAIYPKHISEHISLLDFNLLNSVQTAVWISDGIVVLENVIKPKLPVDLINQFNYADWFEIKINGTVHSDFSYDFDIYNKNIVFKLNNLSSSLTIDDNVIIEGKFIQL